MRQALLEELRAVEEELRSLKEENLRLREQLAKRLDPNRLSLPGA